MQVWDKDLELTQSLQVAGQVISLDSWEDYIAVGSDVIQLIKLNSNGDPRRILYANRCDPIQVQLELSLLVCELMYHFSHCRGHQTQSIWLHL